MVLAFFLTKNMFLLTTAPCGLIRKYPMGFGVKYVKALCTLKKFSGQSQPKYIGEAGCFVKPHVKPVTCITFSYGQTTRMSNLKM